MSAKTITRGKIFYSVYLQTRQLACLNEIFDLFYLANNGQVIKTVRSTQELFFHMDYLVLAHWIMGDGSKRAKGLILCTDNFSLQEVVLLVNILIIKFDINPTVQKEKNKFRIYINEKSLMKIKPLILPYFIPSMFYKIDKTSTRPTINNFSLSNKGTIIDLKPYVQIRSFGSYSILQNNRNFGQEKNNYVNTLHPWFITGFCDAEGSFNIKVIHNTKLKLGYSVYSSFQLTLHSKDQNLLFLIQSFFGGIGKIHIHSNKEVVDYRVNKLDDLLNIIIPHFDKFPLQSAKMIDYNQWKQCILLMANKEHLTQAGLYNIVTIKDTINKGLPEKLKVAFPNASPMVRPNYTPH